jgi:hypothetical protein
MNAFTFAIARLRFASLAAVASLLMAPLSQAATSGIVGFYQVPIPAGNSAWVCGLVTKDVYQGASVTVSADGNGRAVVTFDAPGWTTNEFNLHYAEPASGTCAGLAIDILSNTDSSLTLDTTPAAAGLTSGMVFTVRKHATIAGLFPDGGGFLPFTDSLSIFSSNGTQQSYFFNSINSTWINALGANSNNVIIRSGQGIVIQATNALTVTMGKGEVCHVKTTPTKIKANASVPNLIGALNPLGSTTTLGALGITSSLQAYNDSVVVLAPGSLSQTGTYLSNGSNLINGLGQNASSTSLPSGASVVINVDAAKNMALSPVSVSP